MLEIATLQQLAQSIKNYGTEPALVVVGQNAVNTMSFAQLADGAQQIAEDLRRHCIQRHEPVAIVAPNSTAWIVTCFGILAAGAAVMPLDVRQSEAEWRALAAGSRCRLLYSQADAESPFLSLHILEECANGMLRAAMDSMLPIALPGDMALLLHTSGTTGTPKTVPLTHTNVLSNIRSMGAILQLSRADRTLLPLPLHHVYPLVVGLLLPLSCHASVVLPSGISGPELSRALQVGGANWLIGVPRLYDAMLAAINERVKSRGKISVAVLDRLTTLSTALARRGGHYFGRIVFERVRQTIAPGLRRLASGGAALDVTTEQMLQGLGYEVLVGYGLTETAPILSLNRPGHARIGSAGQPLPGVELRIVKTGADENGEIEVRGPNVFAGYRDEPAATRESFTADGWFRTGDLGRVDAQGYLYVHGRSTETLVLLSGEKLDPEVVEAGYESPMIDEIAVLVQDGKLVGLVVPSTVARTGRDGQSAEAAVHAAISTCEHKLRSYMQLAGFALTDKPLPRTELGKLRRHLLPALYRASRAQMQARVIEPAQISPADRALLEEPAAQQIWSWLRTRFPEQRLSLEMSPQLDLGVDSLGWIALTMDIERALGITLDEAALEHVSTLRDLIEVAIAAEPAPAVSRLVATWLARPGVFARVVYIVGHAINRGMIRLMFPLEVEGLEHLPERGPYVLCPNHASLLDPPVLAAALPWRILRQLYWAGSIEVMFSSAWRRLFSRIARVLPIDPVHGARAGLKLTATALHSGRILAWFPEGWLSMDGTLQPFMPGIGLLMLEAAVPVVPVYIDGTFAAMPAQRRLPRRHRLTVRFGPRLDPKQWAAFAQHENAEESIAVAIKAAVTALQPQAGCMNAGRTCDVHESRARR
ncbi:MAG: AMP-binding protein [Vulcanimicrobiaceae bacterium]